MRRRCMTSLIDSAGRDKAATLRRGPMHTQPRHGVSFERLGSHHTDERTPPAKRKYLSQACGTDITPSL